MQKSNIFYLGPEGSFSHLCALKISKELFENQQQIELSPVSTISSIRTALRENKDKNCFGLIPVENSLGGSVAESLDGLLEDYIQQFKIKVLFEWVLTIEHCLIGFSSLNLIEEIRAHNQAFNQCKDFLQKNFPQAIKKEMNSNSSAAVSLLKDQSKDVLAAISSKQAAELYGIPILKECINDSLGNYTRFWLVGREPLRDLNHKDFSQRLISMAFRIPQDEPGGLVKVLSCFAKRNINLTKIESRPTRGRLCEYTFFIDLLKPENWDEINSETLKEFENLCSVSCFWGDYPVLPLNDLRFVQ